MSGKEISNDPWRTLRQFTDARIGLQRSGASLATTPLLQFQLAHARARDAVHAELDVERLRQELAASGPVMTVDSAAENRRDYLMRPDLGRRLDESARDKLAAHAGAYDIAVVIADGLAANAAQTHAVPVITELLPMLRKDWKIAPLVIARHARVAIGDAVAAALGTRSVAILIGERPGLSAPDSLGAYLTWQPCASVTDADRNCISNIRAGGIGYADAAFKIAQLLQAMRAGGVSGVALKDESGRLQLGNEPSNRS
jgi:ethanolamine ammonia-lyase small subunit